MEEQKFSFSGSFQKTKEYVDTQLEILKLKAISKSSRIIGAIVLDVSKLMLALAIIFFWSLALGFWLGELLGSYSLGFLATGGIFLIILLIVRAIEPKLEAKFMDLTIKKILGKWNEEEDFIAEMEREESQRKQEYKAPEGASTTVKDIFEKEIDHESKY
ncbi:MAG: phage holin family protein [Sphingobacterium composti]|uniref:phage holin family protein n=1 Tax=Sphingobacterium composti TaxID=363260 RepID=UPI001915D37A|nr:phage holin family protein [Sphingobacterium composti Ten et al. 2007 non Yoo et al. 2007]